MSYKDDEELNADPDINEDEDDILSPVDDIDDSLDDDMLLVDDDLLRGLLYRPGIMRWYGTRSRLSPG